MIGIASTGRTAVRPISIALLSVAALCISIAGCGSSGDAADTPAELYDECIAVFERKGGPAELGQQMCDSMKAACEADPDSEECRKAQRIVEAG